jgi:glycosyltransferase involved in cell wall biosynthesis
MSEAKPLLSDLFAQSQRALKSGDAGQALALLQSLDTTSLDFHARTLLDLLQNRAKKALGTGAQHLLSELDLAPPKPGISLVTACMNRQRNLLKALPTWLATAADEIIVVDWSSTQPVAQMLAHIDDPRLKVVRIEGEKHWVMTHAFNVGLHMAQHERIFKLDADIALTPEFLERNTFGPGEFIGGFWKRAVDAGDPVQRFTNGCFGTFKNDLRLLSYYSERILTYGWDDSDLCGRLSGSLGRTGRLLANDSLHHLAKDETQRLENQDVAKALVLGHFAPTEIENLTNKYHELISLEWSGYMSAQNIQLEESLPRRWCGRRITAASEYRTDERDLAQTLAFRQIATHRVDFLSQATWKIFSGIELGRLFKQAQAQGVAERLIDALSLRSALHLMACESGALREATEHTMRIVFDHMVTDNLAICIIADDGFRPSESDLTSAGVLRASQALVDELARVLNANTREDLRHLETCVADPSIKGCTLWRISAHTIAASAIAQASAIANQLQDRYVRPREPAAHTALSTSVYDERNLLRLLEYLACVALNLEAVQHLLMLYEARNGLFQLVVQAMSRQLGLEPARLSLLPFDGRPTFEELFAVQRLLPHGTLLLVGNADVAFDATLAELAEAARDDHVYVLSRWDIAEDGRSAQLIRLESGMPNVYSSDAWIARTPFVADFFLDYPIGTFHCDSFINHQISRSQSYRWANPCLDVHAFHLHDSRFNSSKEKQVRDEDEILQRYRDERLRNGGVEPTRGATWSNLAHAHIASEASFLVQWMARAVVIDLSGQVPTLPALLWLHLLLPRVLQVNDAALVVRLRTVDSASLFGGLLAHYKLHFNAPVLLIENNDASFKHAQVQGLGVVCRTTDAHKQLDTLRSEGFDAWERKIYELLAWPEGPESGMPLRINFKVHLNDSDTLKLIQLLQAADMDALDSLTAFANILNPWGEEARLLQPFKHHLLASPIVLTHAKSQCAPRVSLVTSLFRGGEFLCGYLENVAEAARAADGEVVLVDANCDGYDTEGIERFFHQRPELRSLFDIVQLDRDPGLYACWQHAIERSRGEYVSNANLEDRRSPQHTRRLVSALDAHPHLVGAAGSISAVYQHDPGSWFDLLPNQVWFADLGEREFGFDELYLTNDDGSIRSHNVMHCMPVWLRCLHERYGFFDEAQYGTSADWAFWLRCGKEGERFWLDPQAFGRYFVNPESHNRRNDLDGAKERQIIADHFGLKQATFIKQ